MTQCEVVWIHELAKMLGRSTKDVQRLYREGQLPPAIFDPPHRLCWSKRVIERWLESDQPSKLRRRK